MNSRPKNITRVSTLKFAHLNVRSLVAHFSDIKDILLTNNIDVFGLTETWLNEQISSINIKIDGFDFLRCDRGKRGGGVGIYIRSSINYSVLRYAGETEQIWLTLRRGGVWASFSVVYRPPTYDYKAFLDGFESMISQVIPKVEYVFSVGDFNVNLLNNDTIEARSVIDFLESVGLTQIINEPTRTTMLTATLIDYILTSDLNIISNSGVLPVPHK